MGTRATLTWTTVPNVANPAAQQRQKLIAHWGSPAYKIPTLVDYFAACSALRATPSPDGYRNYAELLHDADYVIEPYTDLEEPGDLSYRYEVHVVTDRARGSGWRAAVAVYRRHFSTDAGPGFVGTLAHSIAIGAEDMGSGYQAAAELLRTLADHLRRAGREDLADATYRRAQRYEDLASGA